MPETPQSSRRAPTNGSPGSRGSWQPASGWPALVVAGGVPALAGAGPLLLIAYLGWLLFWRPAVVVHDAGVSLENPFRAITVPWAALVQVDTRYALTLVTPGRSYGAWAAPAPGIWGGRNARPEDLRGLPDSTYGPGNSVRPGDLKSTDSGQAAQLVRARWQQLVESGLPRRRSSRDHSGHRRRSAGARLRRP